MLVHDVALQGLLVGQILATSPAWPARRRASGRDGDRNSRERPVAEPGPVTTGNTDCLQDEAAMRGPTRQAKGQATFALEKLLMLCT